MIKRELISIPWNLMDLSFYTIYNRAVTALFGTRTGSLSIGKNHRHFWQIGKNLIHIMIIIPNKKGIFASLHVLILGIIIIQIGTKNGLCFKRSNVGTGLIFIVFFLGFQVNTCIYRRMSTVDSLLYTSTFIFRDQTV